MRRLIWPALLILLASACTAVKHTRDETVRLTPEEAKQAKAQVRLLKSQMEAKEKQIAGEEESAAETRRELQTARQEHDSLSEELEVRLDKMEKLVAEAQKLAQKLRPPTAEEEDAAELLLLEARWFQKQNPTEAKSIIASKYKLVFERYPRTKAAKEAEKIYGQLTK